MGSARAGPSAALDVVERLGSVRGDSLAELDAIERLGSVRVGWLAELDELEAEIDLLEVVGTLSDDVVVE